MSTTTNTPNPSTQTQTTNTTSPTTEGTKEAHVAFTTSLKTISSNHDAALQERTRTLHSNASALEDQEASLRRTTGDLARQNEGLAGLVGQAGSGLKDIGDVQNWAEVVERDLLVLEETLRGVEGDGYGEGEREEEGEGEEDGRMNGKDTKDGEGLGKRGWLRWW